MRSRTYIATPPGATIKEQLNDRGISQKEFALRMDMSEKHISKLINGDVQLTPEMSIRLEMVLGVPAKFWNNLEAFYREKLIKAQAENEMDEDEQLVKQFPYSEMAKYGWVPETRNSKEKVINLRKYFEVVRLTLLQDNKFTNIVYRRLATTEKSDFALMAWTQEAKIEARKLQTEPINIKRLIEIIPEIRKMTLKKPEEFSLRLSEMLAECGIALVFLPHLKGSFLHGASFIDGKKIILGLTVRGNDADKFWFSLFRELAHIVLGHIGQADGTSEEDEKNADIWAMDKLISTDKFNQFIENKSFDKKSVRSFARNIDIAPGIVVARLQKEGYIKHNMLNDLKEQYVINV